MGQVRPNIDEEIDLVELFDKYNERYFNNELDRVDLDISWSKRMTVTAGQVLVRTKDSKPISLKISYPLMSRFPQMLISTMVHEMIHIKHPNSRHGVDFLKEVDRLKTDYKELKNLSITYDKKFEIYRYVYSCVECGMTAKRRRRLGNGMMCGLCGSEIEIKKDYGKLQYNEEEL